MRRTCEVGSRWMLSPAAALLLVAALGSCDDAAVDQDEGFRLYLLDEGLISDLSDPAGVDLSAASIVIADGDIIEYWWDEQRLVLTGAAIVEIADERLGTFASFVLSFDGGVLVAGWASWEEAPLREETPQIRYGDDGVWLSGGDWPDPDGLLAFGIAADVVAEIRVHFESSGRLR